MRSLSARVAGRRYLSRLILAALACLLAGHARADVTDFLVEDWCSVLGNAACPSTLDTVVTWQKRDLPGLAGPPGGFQASHSVTWPSSTSYVLQTFSFAPFRAFVPSSGDGGQLLYLDANRVTGVETRDGGVAGNQYFAPAGCAVDGWTYFQPSNLPTGRWTSTVARLVDVPQPTGNCPAPASAYTRWRTELARMRFNWGGLFWRDVWVIIAEHFAGASIAEAPTMERVVYCQHLGWCAWQAWTSNLNAQQETDVQSRCPGIYVKGGPYPLAEPGPGWWMTGCRQWTNIQWAGDGRTTVRAVSWSP